MSSSNPVSPTLNTSAQRRIRSTALRVAMVTNYIPNYRYPIFKDLLTRAKAEFRIFTSAPVDFSCVDARTTLPLKYSRSFNFRFGTRHGKSRGTQYEQLPIPIGLLNDILSFKPDIIISGDYGLRSLTCWLLARLLRAKFVLWSEEIEASAYGRSALQKRMRRFLAKHSDAFLAWGTPAKKYLVSAGANDKHIYLCQQAVDNAYWARLYQSTNREQLRQELRLNKTTFLLVGRLVEIKGFANFIKAWSNISAAYQNSIQALIVGDGEQRKELEGLITQLRINNIELVGAKNQEELAQYYAAADVFVFPSLIDVWGLVVNEALCFGLPVLASKFAGSSLGLIDGSSMGTLFDPTNIDEFSDMLSRFASNPIPRDRESGQALLASVTFESCVQTIASMLDDLQQDYSHSGQRNSTGHSLQQNQ